MNQIFRKWLEITISIHFKLVEQGGSRRTDASKRETFQNPSDDFYSSKKMMWMFFFSKFIDQTPLFRLKRTPGINEIMDFFDCGIEIRPDKLNHLGPNIVNDTRRPKCGNFQPETERFIIFFLRGGPTKAHMVSTVFTHPEPFFFKPSFLGLHLFPWLTCQKHPKRYRMHRLNMDCAQGTAMMKAPKAAEPMW